MGLPDTQPRTDALRQQDRKRKSKQSAKRKATTGNPGRANQQNLKRRDELLQSLVEQFDGREPNESIFSDISIPEASGRDKRILEVLFKDPHNLLTNQQIAEVVGCNRMEVGKFRESRRMYSLLANADVFDRVLERLEIKTLMALERNIELGDNQSMDKVLKMRGRLADARQNVLVIADSDVVLSVTESLKSLLPPKQPGEAVDASYTIEGEGVTENEDTE